MFNNENDNKLNGDGLGKTVIWIVFWAWGMKQSTISAKEAFKQMFYLVDTFD